MFDSDFLLVGIHRIPTRERGALLDQKTIRKTLIFREFSKEQSKRWFSFTRSKFISHVDTFYYSVKVAGIWPELLGARTLVQALKTAKEEARKKGEPVPFMEDDAFGDLVVPGFGYHMYQYCVSKQSGFDIFVAESLPSDSTSEIVVQLRSQNIWLSGTRDAFYESLVYLEGLLDRYSIRIADIKENRLDIAWHTNYIQDMLSFFSDKHLGQMQVSSFKRWGKEGDFLGDEMFNDYISLGRRKSNSSFVRIYNKSKEVIEMGYKQFFVQIWLESGLISAFDKYVFDQVFGDGKQSWNYKEVARCKFYLEYGEDEEIKKEIQNLLAFEDSAAADYKAIADSCVPDLTEVVNIEVQVMRKYTKTFLFPKIEYPEWVPVYERRSYKFLHMLQSIRDFITHDTIRFVKYKGEFAKMRRERRPTADWWKRLSACPELEGIHYDLCREYQKRYDLQRSKSRSLTNLATLATLYDLYAYRSMEDFDLAADMSYILTCMNDNDRERYSRCRGRKQKELKSKFRDVAEDVRDGFVEMEDTDGEIANLFGICCS